MCTCFHSDYPKFLLKQPPTFNVFFNDNNLKVKKTDMRLETYPWRKENLWDYIKVGGLIFLFKSF